MRQGLYLSPNWPLLIYLRPLYLLMYDEKIRDDISAHFPPADRAMRPFSLRALRHDGLAKHFTRRFSHTASAATTAATENTLPLLISPPVAEIPRALAAR